MSNPRNTPASPRSPKVQQEFWTSTSPQQIKSLNSPRLSKNELPIPYSEHSRSPSVSIHSSSYGYGSAFSRKHENPPRSPKITTTFANNYKEASTSNYRSPSPVLRSPTNYPASAKELSVNSQYVDRERIPTPIPSSRHSPKFVFDVPPFEDTVQIFEPYNVQSPAEDSADVFRIEDVTSVRGHSPKPLLPSPRNLKRENLPILSPKDTRYATANSREEYFKYHKEDTDLNVSNLFIKRDSCVTETTQVSMDSTDTNTTSGTGTTTLSYDKSTLPGSDKQGDELIETDEHIDRYHKRLGRRHAINITSNPGYQTLHSSHSTLDRTCSDSVVSSKFRKSASDLTYDMIDTSPKDGSQTASRTKLKRRGSSKSGLAYLAYRRSSRESAKSSCSNMSVISNDELGPLDFQACARSRQRRTSNFLELPVPDYVRPRVCSLPDGSYNPRLSDELYRLRHFSISKGNVVNFGDSIISRRSKSNTSVNSTNSRASERSPFDGPCCGRGYANVDSLQASPDSPDSTTPPLPRYRIVMLGISGVGKTALVSQFMTSEYMHTYDASLDDEFGEKTVSVLLDDEQSELVFIDHPSVEMGVENCLTTYDPHGCVVVFSIVDKTSFETAEEIINYLWKENITKDKAVILVGNKADLARSRIVTAHDGKALAASRDAKFIETSSGIQHNVDELLVGILKQIRLKENRERKATSTKMNNSRTHISLNMAKDILQKICLSDITKSKSCENLHVL